jgi:uncharacterized alpha-E superfamily protein
MTHLLARFAEDIFWLARYMERVENLARILDVNETFSRDARGSQNWLSIVQLHADEERFFTKHQAASPAAVIHYYVLDTENPTSIVASLKYARENARTLRPLISTEMWSHLNVFYGQVKALEPSHVTRSQLSRVCAWLKESCQTHAGIVEGTFYRDEGWTFYNMGKMIERADQTTRLLDIKYHLLLPSPSDVGSPLDISQWNAVLRSAAGYHAFRRVYPRGMDPKAVAGFLLFNISFPRSFAGSVAAAENALAQMKSRYHLRGGNFALELFDDIRAALGTYTIDDVLRSGLHEFLDHMQRQLILVTDELGYDFFGHVRPAQEPARPTRALTAGSGQSQVQSSA